MSCNPDLPFAVNSTTDDMEGADADAQQAWDAMDALKPGPEEPSDVAYQRFLPRPF